MAEGSIMPSGYVARRFPWRYDDNSEIDVFSESSTVPLRNWSTVLYHMADGSTTVSEIMNRLKVYEEEAQVDDRGIQIRASLSWLVAERLIVISETPSELDRSCYLSIDGEA